MNPARLRLDETVLWLALAAFFPLFFWTPGYDSFHEPKWLLLSIWVGVITLFRGLEGRPVFHPRTALDPPMWACLFVTLLAWRWQAADRWMALFFWLRLALVYLLYRLLVSWLSEGPRESGLRKAALLQNAFILGGAVVGGWAIAQDWGFLRWGNEPVSDWRFHLSSTLGNPNEVGGYLSYLLPVIAVRWFKPPDCSSWKAWLWGSLGLLFLYGLTTVFTVGAWLGLFLILPLSLFWWSFTGQGTRGRSLGLAAIVSGGCYGVLRLALHDDLSASQRTVFFLAACGILLLAAALFLPQMLSHFPRRKCAVALAGVLGVWTCLLLPWGLPNHPDGLAEEALASPRWKGGFGARRFIWETTALMIKDQPLRGIGWGHYYNLHNLYQGELYRQRNLPHDRPSVGLVPQAHSDPLQIAAEAGFPGLTCFLWLALALFRLARGSPGTGEPLDPSRWAAATGLCLVFFHCLVDFPLRQPQPVLYVAACLAMVAGLPGRGESAPGRNPSPRWARFLWGMIALALVVGGLLGLRDQRLLKRGFEGLLAGATQVDPAYRSAILVDSANSLDSIFYPLPETHDRWLYRARTSLALGDLPPVERALLEAGKYRHSLALYEAWLEYAREKRDTLTSLGAVQGLLLYNPCWAGYHQEAARLLRLMGDADRAEMETREAERLEVPRKPGP